ncbi:hypothetical protein SAMN05216389_106169 [Oceanobacillus limi]|uniref:WYL domain-containing protein n=1 Tax=Oceanobacillus limi TaxID=930131 RepID=A0A1I0CDG4_9BACI|nr:hypothetical protein [Oceanobacillus limi]SET17465.1 hypothetical protein SAMN05216389_106169 [Oceanobacillus limi]
MNNWFLQSKELKKKIMIFYMDRNQKITQRIIRVVELKEDHVVAFCYYRKKVRTFRTDNILSAGPLQKDTGT